LRTGRDADRGRHALAATFDDPELAFAESRLDQEGPRTIAVGSSGGHILGRRPLRGNEVCARHACPADENVVDDRLAIDGEQDRLPHERIAEPFQIGSKLKEARRLGGHVMREQMRPIRETIEGPREISLEHGPRRDVDLAPKKRLERRGATREEMDLEPAELGCSQHVALVRREGGDRERSGMDRLARVRDTLLGGGLRKPVAGHHAGPERVVVPSLSVPVEDADLARRQNLDIRDSVGHPPRERAGSFCLVLLPRETHVGRRYGDAILPLRVPESEGRDEASVGRVRVVGHDPEIAVLEGRDGFGEPGRELVVRVAPNERLGDGGSDEAG